MAGDENEFVPTTQQLVDALIEAGKSHGHYNTLREVSQDTIDYWAGRIEWLRDRLCASKTGRDGADTKRLDALEAYVAENGGLVLHNGNIRAYHAGLGLANTNRSLRRAIDDMAGIAQAERQGET